jgi:hypothetical protein
MRTPGMIGRSGKCPGKKLSFIVTFFIPTAVTPGLYSITLSTSKNGNLCIKITNKNNKINNDKLQQARGLQQGLL